MKPLLPDSITDADGDEWTFLLDIIPSGRNDHAWAAKVVVGENLLEARRFHTQALASKWLHDMAATVILPART